MYMPKDKIVKVYVRPDDTAVINCPHCGRHKTVPVDSYKGCKNCLKIKCSCQNLFTVNLEFRKRIRKRTNLRGTYTNNSQKNSRGNLVVRNISVNGLEFSSVDVHSFKVDDELTVNFTLDDEQRSEISKEVIVRDIRKSTVGCEFERSGDLAFDGPLGFYIMS